MKNTLLIAHAAVDLAAKTDRLPRSNEDDIKTSQTRVRYGGLGWCAASVFQTLHFRYDLLCGIGSGLYGDAVRSEAKRLGIVISHHTDETAGCSFTLRDPQGQQGVMVVPGGEYRFKAEWCSSIDPDDVKYAAVDGGMLEGQDSQQLLSYLKNYDRKIYFVPGGRGVLLDQKILNAVYALHPLIAVSEEELSALSPDQKDLISACTLLHEKTQGAVVVLLQNGSSFYLDGRQTVSDSSRFTDVKDPGGVEETYASAFLAAVTAGLNVRSAMAFAGSYASRVALSINETLEGREAESMAEKLKEMILGNSRV